jgi:hypothetical protein
VTWAYLAGFTDGDGCIVLEVAKGTYRYARLRWSQKLENARVLEEIAAFLRSQGLKVSSRNFSVATKGHRYPQCELAITNGDDTRKALEEMLPFLIVKRDRAVQALAMAQFVARMKEKYGNKYRRHLRVVA